MRHWCLLALGLSLSLVVRAQSVDSQTLAAGVPIDARLDHGQTHTYEVTLGAGDFAFVAIQRTLHRSEVVVTDPSGRQRLTSTWRVIAIVAEQAGRYQLRLRPDPQRAPLGSYRIVLENRRPATTTDRALAAGYQAMSEAQQLSGQAGVDKFASALAHFRQSGDGRSESGALLALGSAQLGVGADPDVGRASLEAAAALARSQGDVEREASALMSLASSFRALAERPTSLAHGREALRLFESIGHREMQSIVLNNMGNANNDLGEYRTALDLFDRALPLATAVGDVGNEARIYTNRGLAMSNAGQVPEALDSYTRALPLSRATRNTSLELILFNNMGIIYKQLGDYRRALESYELALSAYRRAGNALAETQVLGNMGNVHQDLGDLRTSLDTTRKRWRLLAGSAAARTKPGS